MTKVQLKILAVISFFAVLVQSELIDSNSFVKLKVFTEKATFFKAYSECARNGMDLVEPKDVDQHFELADLMAKYDFNDLWLGAVDFVESRYFRWARSGRSVRYFNWGSKQPNNDLHRCLIIDRVVKYKWNDQDCHSLRNFVCMFQYGPSHIETNMLRML